MTNDSKLDGVRRARSELIRNGRWKEADLPEGEPERAAGARVAVLDALRAAHRGTGRTEAADTARHVLRSVDSLDVGTFWRAVLVLTHADEVTTAHRHWACSAHRYGRDVHDVLGARIMLRRRNPCAAARLLDCALGRGVRPRLRVVATAWLVQALVETGELRRARVVLEDRGPAGGHPDEAELLFASGRLLFAEGRAVAALDELLGCGQRLARSGVVNPAVLPWRSAAALAATAAEDHVLARICADKDLVAARRWGAPRAAGLALHAGALARGGDDVRLEEALAHLDLAATADEVLRARHDLAQLLLARGEVGRAREHTRSLREAAAAACCPQWTSEAEDLTCRLLRNDGESALSDQQRRVARLARAGKSNREIAAELHLTLRTVEFHLTAVYRKMGVAGRPGLRRAYVPSA
ncbi:regulatory protein, luxR family [Lentzea fradiae]|uniref:Regulatory protein, luxR family n=1 Tax=Lentzea fradiae TaxID=200378 RepID=A0A1G7Z999_9PSEU|nr:helix-turn-helix transcriptional regulator [Lentzea fradiae]SDH05313.1 regulatory protein, luxR family [Lentzea fradiae]